MVVVVVIKGISTTVVRRAGRFTITLTTRARAHTHTHTHRRARMPVGGIGTAVKRTGNGTLAWYCPTEFIMTLTTAFGRHYKQIATAATSGQFCPL